jgi:type I restriction enzyme S subunit
MKEGWKTRNLDALCRIRTGKKDVNQGNPDGEFPFFTCAAEHTFSDSYSFDAEALLIAGNGDVGKVSFYKGKFEAYQRTYVLTDFSEVLTRFLFLILDGKLKDTVSKQKLGNTMPYIKVGMLTDFQVPVPPLPEQQRIVGILDEAFEGIATAKANAEKNGQNTRALFKSHLDEVFTKRGEGWVETTLERVLSVQPQNGWSPPAANHSDSGTPVLTLSSVTGFSFKPDKRKYTSASTDSRRHYWVKNGDFLITRSNTPELVGHVAIASGIHEPTIYPDLIMRMNPAPDRMMTEFLYYQMRSPSLRKEITGRARGANPTMKKISNGAVKTLPIAVPPISTQRAIVETLKALAEEIQHLESIYQKKLAVLEALKKSLLHQAFSGELGAQAA